MSESFVKMLFPFSFIFQGFIPFNINLNFVNIKEQFHIKNKVASHMMSYINYFLRLFLQHENYFFIHLKDFKELYLTVKYNPWLFAKKQGVFLP